MKKVSVLIGLALLLVGLLAPSALAQGPYVVWTVGTFHGAVNPIVGAGEYPANNLFYGEYTHTIGANSPLGYIGPDNVCAYAGGRPCTDTAQTYKVQFEVACNIGNASLRYDRYGSETDDISLNGVPVTSVSVTENIYKRFDISLGSLTQGTYTLTFAYAGGGDNNGHYIDAMQLTSEKDPACQLTVVIDIKPGSDPNSININGNGVIPVAINGSASFDVTQIDPASLLLNGTAVRLKKQGPQCAVEDWNGDGYQDLVCQFVDNPDNWDLGETYAEVTGSLYDGTVISGQDWVNIVP